MDRITSRRNPVVQEFRALAERPGDRVLLDGAHLLDEALTAGLDIEIVVAGDRATSPEADDLMKRAAGRGARLVAVTDAVLSAVSPVQHPSGLVAIARRRTVPLETALADPPQLVLILSHVQDPGNVGAIIRAADACGATGIITTEGTADPFQWKALRGSMGSCFRLPVATRQPLARAADVVRSHGIRLLAAVPVGGTPLPRCDLRAPIAGALGNEGGGLPAFLIGAADECLTIPMRAPVESLNVATAAALVAYEAQRQREETAR
jgi:RNA methyltransferase, TrmH family